MHNEKHYFSLHLNQKEWLKYYSGRANAILVTTTTGLKISIPAHNFIKFTMGNGIYGFFCMTISPQKKILGLQKME